MAMFILKGILRAESQEKILIYLLVRESGYGKAIAEFYGLSQNAVQKQQDDNVVVSQLVGRLREYRLNPGYSFYTPLKALLKSALAAYPDTIIQQLAMRRSRPRKAGKPADRVR
jgi:hypothetical protein